jgi:hypothetical protein
VFLGLGYFGSMSVALFLLFLYINVIMIIYDNFDDNNPHLKITHHEGINQ